MLLLSKEYVNNNAAKEFQLTKDMPLEFLLTMAYANATKLKKVAIVKDFLAPLLDHTNSISSCDDLNILKLIRKYLEINNKMLILGHPKVKKFLEGVQRRIDMIKKENGQEDTSIDKQEAQALIPEISMLIDDGGVRDAKLQGESTEKEREEILESFAEKL